LLIKLIDSSSKANTVFKTPLDSDVRALRTEAIAVFLVWHVRLILAQVDWLIIKTYMSAFSEVRGEVGKNFCEDTWVAWKKKSLIACFSFDFIVDNGDLVHIKFEC